MALVSDILLRITGTSDDARRSLREVAAEVAAFNAVDAEVRIRANPKDAFEKIAEVDAALRLIGTRKVSATVKVDIDGARARLRLLKAELEHALRGGAGARPVAAIAQDIALVGAEVAKLGADLGSFGAKLGGALAQVGGSLGSGLTSLLSSVAGGLVTVAATIGLVAVAAAILVPIIVGLAGVLGALVASLAAAVVGFGALLTTGIFAAIPVLAVAIFAVVRLVGAVKALKDAEKNKATVTRQLRDAEQAHTDAIKAKQDATENLARTQIEASKAERDAILAVRDAQLSLAESKLGIQDANLALERAKLHLDELGSTPALGGLIKKFKDVDSQTDPKKVQALIDQVDGAPGGTQKEIDIKQALLDVAHAQLGVKEAKQREVHATNDLADANARNLEFVKKGILAYQPYASAIDAVAAADRRLRDTTEATSDIRIKQAAATKKYSEAELAAGDAAIKLFDALKKALQPVAGPASAGLLKFFQGLEKLVANPRVRGGLRDIGKALGAVFEDFGNLLASDEVVDLFGDIAHAAADLTKTVGKGVFHDLFLIFLRIARSAAPALVDLFRQFARFLDRLVDGTSHARSLNRGVRSVVSSFKDWLELAHQLARVVINFFTGAKGTGDSLVRTVTRLLRRWANFLGTKEGQAAVKRFLAESVDTTKDFFHTLGDIYNIFKTIVDIVNALADAIKRVVDAIGDTVLGDIVKGIAGGAGQVAGGGSLGDVLGATIHPGSTPGDDEPLFDDDQLAALNAKRKKKGLPPLNNQGNVVKKRGRAQGGFVDAPAAPGSDNVLQPLSGGEFVLNADVTSAIGLPALNALNSGAGFRAARTRTPAGSHGTVIQQQDVHLPPSPGHDQMGDPRDAAAKFAAEMRRRGNGKGV